MWDPLRSNTRLVENTEKQLPDTDFVLEFKVILRNAGLSKHNWYQIENNLNLPQTPPTKDLLAKILSKDICLCFGQVEVLLVL